jgi:signal peptidase I
MLRASLVEAFFVPSSSMRPTLREDDYILVPKFLYGLQLPLLKEAVVQWANPKRGDVIVFKLNSLNVGSETDETVVKRVIGVEGDLVEILGTKVILNGATLNEPYAEWGEEGKDSHHLGPYRVPAGSVFVLGDNRGNSDDSRFWREPFVSLSQVIGKAVIVYWSGAKNNRAGIIL